MSRITLDPITRIEGHLRIDCDIEGGHVKKAWSSGQMWRGIEKILEGRDPREAWMFTQRICGVCTTVHAITSVRAVENALKLPVPMNAQLIRNMIITAHSVHDHIVHFYHLCALDWVDITSAIQADPVKTLKLAETVSDWNGNSLNYFKEVKAKLKSVVDSGQLGIFANGYWGHPAMKLPPELNLLAAAHYLKALEYQRKANEIVSILGSKTPHIQNLAVGGVSNPINPNSQATLTIERLLKIKTQLDEIGDFVKKVYFVDACAVAAHYADWTKYGKGVTTYLSVPELPLDEMGTQFSLPGGYLSSDGKFTQIRSFDDEFFSKNVQEASKHSWYSDDGKPLHPYEGKTNPKYTDFQADGKYSWVKAPTFEGKPAQVGPLANVLAMFHAGHEPTKKYTTAALKTISSLAGASVGVDALHSTIGRIGARAIRCQVYYDELVKSWDMLIANIGKGDVATYNKPNFPSGMIKGVGFHEAPRGVLSHWTVIDGGKIKNYQCVVPSTWNAAPRNDSSEPGPYEASLVGNPIADQEKPLEVLRTIHSFDPCLACAIHLTDTKNRKSTSVQVLGGE